MVFHLLKHQRQRGLDLAHCLADAMNNIQHCQHCNNFSEQDICHICADPSRDSNLICVVEDPNDVLAIEQSGVYKGLYYVLMGKISPIDGIGPEQLGLDRLREHIRQAKIQEVILALSPSIEGQTTIHFIQAFLREEKISISQLAHGIPSGGELSYLDGHTIGSAIRKREALYP